MVDFDGFEAINDTLGQLAGDDVLRQVGAVLRAPWLKGSAAARLGGTSLRCWSRTRRSSPARSDSAPLGSTLKLPVTAGGIGLTAAETVWLATVDPDPHGLRELVRRADADLYAAKRARVGSRRVRERRAS